MFELTTLLDKLPQFHDSRMVSSGYGVWIVWQGDLSNAFPQTLQDHGGLRIVSEREQELWFFFTTEVFRALARLQNWAKLNPMPVFFEVFPATFLVDYDMRTSISVSAEFKHQNILPTRQFEVWVHPKLEKTVRQIPGLGFEDEATPPHGTAHVHWKAFSSDPNYSYESNLAWYFIAKPLGHPLDKDFNKGWKTFFSGAEKILERLGVKYIYNESSLIFPLENLRALRTCCREMIRQVAEVKEDDELTYWPVVMAVVPKEGLNFTEDLPNKVKLEWRRLTPDYPHMSYRNAFLLGGDFLINDISLKMSAGTMDDWCHVSLGDEEEQAAESTPIRVNLPRSFLEGGMPNCYYCGLRNHHPRDCPSKQLVKPRVAIWNRLAQVDVSDFNDLGRQLDENLKYDPVGELTKLFKGSGGPNLLAKAVYEISMPFQLRMLRLVWRSRAKDWYNAFDNLAPQEEEFIWDAMGQMVKGNREDAADLLGKAVLRYSHSYQPKALHGFVAMELDDMNQAMFYWRESDRLSYTPVQHAYSLMLQGRLSEVQLEVERAITLYKQAEFHAQSWLEPVYRQGVCMVKMGFTDHAMGVFRRLVGKDPHMFNRLLLDPELDRGRLQLMSQLGDIWQETSKQAEEAAKQAEELSEKLNKWFAEEHDFSQKARTKVEKLLHLTKTKNYVAFVRLIKGVAELDDEMADTVDHEIKIINKRIDILLERLRDIFREASWFPFPKLLREFNKDFNFCVEKLKWMSNAHLKNAENFKKSQIYISEMQERLKRLQQRLITLRIVRDVSYFSLLLGRNFVWLELVGLGMALVLVPFLLYASHNFGGFWARDVIVEQKWQLQKVLIVVLSIVALLAAILKTAATFERKKQRFYEEEYEKLTQELRERALERRRADRARRRARRTGQAAS